MAVEGGYAAEVTMQSWMFLGSYEKMRRDIVENHGIVAMAHIGARGFDAIGGEVVSTTATVFERGKRETAGLYIRLVDEAGEDVKAEKIREAAADADCPWRYEADAESFKAIPGWPIAYWATRNVINAFNNGKPINQYMDCHSGISVNTQKFVRYWTEVSRSALKTDCTSSEDMADYRWFPMNSGGDYRLFYGNNSKVVDLWHEGVDVIRNGGNFRLREPKLYFKMGLTWGRISSSDIAFRKVAKGTLFGDAGPVGFTSKGVTNYLLGFLVSSVMQNLVEYLNPTMNYQITDIVRLPLLIEQDSKVDGIVSASIETCKIDWDAFETSWDFESHPLAQPGESLVERQFERWRRECQSRFDELKANEEELNRIFARIYHMEDEVPIEVPDDKVSVRRADLARDVRSLVSYGVGCILGRYSLDRPGLVLADQGSTVADYLEKVPEPTLVPDADNILPITDAAWFEDDIVDSFYRFLVAAYGEDSLGDNVAFIEGALGCDLRTYFSGHFYADHLRVYQKRPIYWLFQSPRKSFSCLVYMHRYDESTVGEILTGYLRPLQGKLRSRIELLEKSKSARDAREANRLRAQVQELADWERDVIYPLAHERVSIDLDDGVKVNYNKFPHALAKVPGLSNWK